MLDLDRWRNSRSVDKPLLIAICVYILQLVTIGPTDLEFLEAI